MPRGPTPRIHSVLTVSETVIMHVATINSLKMDRDGSVAILAGLLIGYNHFCI